MNFHLLRLLLKEVEEFEVSAKVEVEVRLRTNGKVRLSIYDPSEDRTRVVSFRSLHDAREFFDY